MFFDILLAEKVIIVSTHMLKHKYDQALLLILHIEIDFYFFFKQVCSEQHNPSYQYMNI